MANKNEKKIYLIDEFNKWNKAGGAGDYVARLKKIDREYISTLIKGENKTPLELLERFMTSSKKSGPNITLVESLLEAISSRLNEKLEQLRSVNAPNVDSFSSERSAFRKYMEFILSKIREGKYRQAKLTINQDSIIKNISGGHIKLDPIDLISIFASRIATQDRVTGNKPFLPLGLLGKFLLRGDLRTWANDAAKDVKIHLRNRTVSVSDILSLEIDTANAYVTVTLQGNSINDVYNPPISGIKSAMQLRLIADSDIDHEPEIHLVLQKLNASLPILNRITAEIHKAKKTCGEKTINSKNCNRIYKEVLKNTSFVKSIENDRQKLLAELQLISANHVLQLASGAWNRSTKKQAKKVVLLPQKTSNSHK